MPEATDKPPSMLFSFGSISTTSISLKTLRSRSVFDQLRRPLSSNMGPRNPRIAVLEADTPLGSIEEKHGTYGDIFETLLNTALKTIESPWEGLEISKWDVVSKMEYPKLDDVDAVLITGSRKHSRYSPLPLTLIPSSLSISPPPDSSLSPLHLPLSPYPPS